MTIDRSSIKLALQAAGSAPVEEVEPRVAGLEARLMKSIAPDAADEGGVIVPFQPRRRASTARRLALGAVAAVVLAVAVLAAGWFSPSDQSLVIAAADDVTVFFPDGSILPGESGLELPVGAAIDVGGSLVIDGVTYGPGDYTVTDDGVEADSPADVDTSQIDDGGSDVAPPTTVAEQTPTSTSTSTSPAAESDVIPASAPPSIDDGPIDPVREPSVPNDSVDRPVDRENRDRQPDVSSATTAPPAATTTPARPPTTVTTTTTRPNDRPTTTVVDQRRTDTAGETDRG